MATKTEQRTDEQRLQEIMAQLKANRTATRSSSNITERFADAAAGLGNSVSRIAAGFAAAAENASLAYDIERERQTRRTAQHLLDLARQ